MEDELTLRLLFIPSCWHFAELVACLLSLLLYYRGFSALMLFNHHHVCIERHSHPSERKIGLVRHSASLDS